MIICYSRKKDTIHKKNCQNVKQISYSNYMEEEIDEADIPLNNLCIHCIKKEEIEGILLMKIKKEKNELKKIQLQKKLDELHKLYELEKKWGDDNDGKHRRSQRKA